MCSTPKPKKVRSRRIYDRAISAEMNQAAYSKMIERANSAYEKRHPQSAIQASMTIQKKQQQNRYGSKSISYWLTQASLTELRQCLGRYITID